MRVPSLVTALAALSVTAACSESATAPTGPAASEPSAVESPAIQPAHAKGGPSPIARAHVVAIQRSPDITAGTATAACPAGEIAVGGGFRHLSEPALVEVIASMPKFDESPGAATTPTGWSLTARSQFSSASIVIYAICVPA